MPTTAWRRTTQGSQLILEPPDGVGQVICTSYYNDGPPEPEAVRRGVRMITGPDVPLEAVSVGGWSGHTARWTRGEMVAQGWWLLKGGELMFITWMRPAAQADAHAAEIAPLIAEVLRLPHAPPGGDR